MNKQKFFNYKSNSIALSYCGPNTGITWCEDNWPVWDAV